MTLEEAAKQQYECNAKSQYERNTTGGLGGALGGSAMAGIQQLQPVREQTIWEMLCEADDLIQRIKRKMGR